MTKLEELIAKLCPDGVEYKTLGEFTIIKTGNKPSFISEDEVGYEYINAGTTNSGYTDTYNCESDTVTTPSRGQGGIGFVGYMDKPFWLGPLCYKIRSMDRNILNKYIYYCLSNDIEQILQYKNSGGVPSLNAKDVMKIKLPVPPLEVQREVVRILDNFTFLTAELVAELAAELAARQKQYEYYRDLLLTFNDVHEGGINSCSIPWFAEMLYKFCPDGVEYKPLWSVTAWDKKFNAVDRSMQVKVFTYHVLLAKDLFAMKQDKGNVFLLSTGVETGWTTEEIAGNSLCEGEVVTIPWGKSSPVKGLIKYYKGKFVTGDNRIATSIDKNILDNKYLYYWMVKNGDVIDNFYRGSGIKHPSMYDVLTMRIHVPPLEIQQRIVSILDRFDKLMSDITSGLPAEIAMRQKQYEYYRDKLLTFKELEKEV